MSNQSRCAACKFLRRRCLRDCIFAPYFPSNNPERFAYVHRVFGASNVSKMLKHLPEHLRSEAADCMYYEAQMRTLDPIFGSAGIISQLQNEIEANERELARTQAQIALCKAQRRQQNHTQETQNGGACTGTGGDSSLNANQQDPLPKDEPPSSD